MLHKKIQLTKMAGKWHAFSFRYSPNSAFNPSSPSACPIVENTKLGRDKQLHACLLGGVAQELSGPAKP